MVGNPVSLNYGAKVETVTDYTTSDGLFGVTRQYRNRPRQATHEIAGFGRNWHGVVPGRITVYGGDAEHIVYLAVDGGSSGARATSPYDRQVWTYGKILSERRQFSMVLVPTEDRVQYFYNGPAVANGPGEFRMEDARGNYILFRRSGVYDPDVGRYLVPVESGKPSGYKIFYEYPDSGEFPNRIRDSFGRVMDLTWATIERGTDDPIDGGDRQKTLNEILLPDATRLQYGYGMAAADGTIRKDRLETVKRVDTVGATLWARSYLYENATYPHSMTGTIDQNGARLSTYTYGSGNVVTSTEQAGGVNRYTIANFEELLWYGVFRHRQVTNPLGRREDYVFTRSPAAVDYSPMKLLSITGHPTANVPADLRSFQYEGIPWETAMTSFTDAEENKTYLPYGVSNDLRPPSFVEASTSPLARATNITWHPRFDFATREERPGLRVDYTHTPSGQILTRTETDTTTQTIPYATTGQSRTWTYDWSTAGRLLSEDGPRPLTLGKDDLTIFAYDAQGNLTSMTNGLGHFTGFSGYDANGRPSMMTDLNGIRTTFTYDALGRAKIVTLKHPTTVGSDAITTLDYDVEGRVIGVKTPTTEKLFIDYNLAGQLTAIRAANGERIDYTHNAMSNVTGEITRRTNATAARTVARAFDELGRMLTETLGPGRTTTWAYDKVGNATRVTSPRSQATDFSFDALNRLVSSVAPDSGTTATGFDVFDDTTSHTDAANVQTTFVRNGFGDIIREVSPDRGTSTFYYDAAGDVTASIDGRGQRIDYTRDILGRVTKKTPVGRPASEIVTYTWDSAGLSGSYGKGRLATVVDGSGTTKFKYDHRGNLLIKEQMIGSATASLTYAYSLGDRVTTMTYPSGRQVLYTYDTKGRVTQVRTRATSTATLVTLMSTMTYEPFGALKSANFGNTLKLTQAWGNDARLASKRVYRATGGANVSLLSYSYDASDNMTAITDGVDPARSTSFGYDPLERLTRIDGNLAGGMKREDHVHDPNGNRIRVERRALATDVTPANTDNYTTAPGTNRLASIATAAGTREITYDARGNTESETRPASVAVSAGYDGYARLVSYAQGGTALAHSYNGLDDRVATVNGSDTRRFVYDDDGRVLGEYGTSATDVKAEYIWLSATAANDNQTPSTALGTGFGGDDGTGGYTPLAIASAPSGGSASLVWVHANHLGVPLTTTDATGTEVTPSTDYTALGFPGQMKTLPDLWYNRHRDYDPGTGRYVQADPIGLAGDANPFAYARGNPLKYIDPSGEFVPLAAVAIGFAVGAAIDFTIQYFGERKDLECIDWTSVGISGGLGALGGGIGSIGRVAKVGKEFSHWIPGRYINPASKSYKPWLDKPLLRDFINSRALNGNYVSPKFHDLTDFYRRTAGSKVADKFNSGLQQILRLPSWFARPTAAVAVGANSASERR